MQSDDEGVVDGGQDFALGHRVPQDILPHDHALVQNRHCILAVIIFISDQVYLPKSSSPQQRYLLKGGKTDLFDLLDHNLLYFFVTVPLPSVCFLRLIHDLAFCVLSWLLLLLSLGVVALSDLFE